MSITIKHKKSAVASSKPTGAQIDNGEIAVNYSDTDPALYIKDSTGAVIRIAGNGAVGSPPDASETVKGIAEIATKAEVTAGTDDGRIVSPLKLKQALDALPPGTTVAAAAPGTPEDGQAWFDTNTDTLKIWDGTAWKTSQPAASETVAGIAEIATKAEVTAGTDDAMIVSPLKLKQALDALPPGTTVAATAPLAPESGQAFFDTTTNTLKIWDGTAWKTSQPAASETVAGIAELATQAEVTTGTDDATIVTPLKLATAVPAATETKAGKAEIATKAEVTAGTDDTRIVSPLKLKQALDDLPPGTTVAAAAPLTPEDGQAWFDSTNSVLKVWDGAAWQTSTPVVWDEGGGGLIPATATNNVYVGGTAAAPKISLNSNGKADFAGNVSLPRLDAVAASNSSLVFQSYVGSFSTPAGVAITADGTTRLGGSVIIGGTLPTAPNITLASTGAITALADATIHGLTVGLGKGSISGNTVVGRDALRKNTTGNNNTVLGSGTLYDNTTGNNNTAIGRDVLRSNTEGDYNTAVGQYSLYANITGSNNIAVGRDVLRFNTTGNNNTAIGQSALYSNTAGDYNTAIGLSALTRNTAGDLNTVVGKDAGYYIEGSNNTILGAYKGTTADSTLSDTVIISAGTTVRARCHSTGIWNLGTSAPVYTDNATAKAGGLVDGDVYRKADGTLMIVFT